MSVVGDNGARYGDGFACLAPSEDELGIIDITAKRCDPLGFRITGAPDRRSIDAGGARKV